MRGYEGNGLADMPSLLMAAHELKAPLVLIRQLALQLEEGSDPDAIERIRLTSERSLRLVESLTRSARLEDSLFATEPISVATLYDDVADELYPLAKALDQTIEIDLPRRPMSIVANPMLVRTILLGLCDNALTHNSLAGPVRLVARRRADKVELGVRDFGPTTDSLRQISRRLGEAVTPIDGRPRSSGLGLMIANQFARHMDAELVLTRHRSVGATFALAIPESKQLSLLSL